MGFGDLAQGGVVSSLNLDPLEPSWLGWLLPRPSRGRGKSAIGGGVARTGRDGGCGLEGVRTGTWPGSLMIGVRAGPGRIFATSPRRLGRLPPPGGDPETAPNGAIVVVVGEEDKGELDDSAFSGSWITPP